MYPWYPLVPCYPSKHPSMNSFIKHRNVGALNRDHFSLAAMTTSLCCHSSNLTQHVHFPSEGINGHYLPEFFCNHGNRGIICNAGTGGHWRNNISFFWKRILITAIIFYIAFYNCSCLSKKTEEDSGDGVLQAVPHQWPMDFSLALLCFMCPFIINEPCWSYFVIHGYIITNNHFRYSPSIDDFTRCVNGS
jgi:hypothetical protein